MDDLDFTAPAQKALYDPAIARSCFEALGKPHSVAEGHVFFAENQASDRMFLVLEGEVRLVRAGKTLYIAKASEIFGEMSVITGQQRTAAAVAKSACRVLSLDGLQFEQAIQRTPEFALMLMAVLIDRLRLAVALLERGGRLAGSGARESERAFDRAQLDELAGALKRGAPQSFPAHQLIMKEGDKGGYMYVVLAGKVAVSIKSTVVERIGPGGVLGEMALVDQSPRAASATAETHSSLLPINRDDFLALVKSRPSFGVALLRSLALRLGQMTARKG